MRDMAVASHLFNSRMNQQLESEGFTLAQFYILNHLAHQPTGISQKISDIVAAVEVLQPAVTKIINKFEVLNLVDIKGDTRDKRVKLITINSIGRQKIQQLQSVFSQDIMAWNQQWADADMQDFSNKLKKLGNWLDANRL